VPFLLRLPDFRKDTKMAIDNPQAAKFCNERLRVAANRIISGIRSLRQMSAEYAANGIGPLVGGSQELLDSLVVDGSATDGRTPLTGYDVTLAISSANALLTWADGDGAAHLTALTKPTTNSQPAF
jgi:hypothetical protein